MTNFFLQTTIRKVLKDFLRDNPSHPIENLLPEVQGNVGFVFTNEDPNDIRSVVTSNRAPAPARVGAFAPVDVFVDPGPTGCDPGQTSWFQALDIPTKINKGQIEMVARVHLINKGDRVTASQAALLEKLAIKPFTYGLEARSIYQNGEVFDAACLDVTADDVMKKLSNAGSIIAAIGMEIGYPTICSLPHSLNKAFKALLAIGMESSYKFDRVKEFEDFLSNPANFVAAAPGATGGGDAGGAAAAAAEEESESSEDAGGAGGLFDDSDSD